MSNETKIVYYIGDETTPYVTKVNIAPEAITLKDFKTAIKKPTYKFFFRSEDKDFGVVKEEITDDNSTLPFSENRVVAWLVAPEDNSRSTQPLPPPPSNPPRHIQQPMNRQLRQSNGRNFSPDSDSHSISSSNRGHLPKHRHQYPSHYDSMSTLSSSDGSTLYYDSRDDMSEYSTCTDTTTSSRYRMRQMRHRYKKRRPRPSSDTTSTYSSSVTDSSMTLNIVDVTLNMEKYNFLGISIVGQSNDRGDGGIYIGSIMKGGAVAADGRIEPGDMLLQVNNVNFENMSNEDAVKELRNIVHTPGPISLTVAKCWDPNPEASYFSPRDEPVRPIDPAAWANHTNVVQGNLQGATPTFSGTRETSSDNLASSLPESDRYENHLSIRTDMAVVVKMLKMPDSGLEVKTRMWLKITIPDAFIGSDLVNWLMQRVDGLAERRDARKYASSLLKMGYIKHTVKKITFSEQRYYVFGEFTGHNIINDFGNLSLGDSNSDRDSETLGPLPVHLPWDGSSNSSYPAYDSQPYRSQLAVYPRPDMAANNGVMDYKSSASNLEVPPPNYSSLDRSTDVEVASSYSYGGNSQRAASVSSFQPQTLASFGAAGSGGSGSDQASESRFSLRSVRSGHSFTKQKPRSSGDKTSVSSQSQMNAPFESPLPPYIPPPQHSMLPQAPLTMQQRLLNSVPLDVSGSRQSFHRAMDNPCDYFVGHL